jgi:C-terminal processing protease CtpA/Prc
LVLTGQKTFSAGVVATAMLKNQLGATVVGSPGAAGFNFFSDMRSRVLPRSGLKLWVATIYWEYDEGGGLTGAFDVDVPVPLTPEAYFAGSDPVLEQALTILGGGERLTPR